MQPAIRIEGISKQYRIGTGHASAYRTLRESVSDGAAAVWRRLARQARNRPVVLNGQAAGGQAPYRANGHAAANGSPLPHSASQNGQAASPPRVADNPNTFWALMDVSFDVQQGEVVGLIGRNGAGKSTLLKILSRITEPTRGKITLHGRVASLLEVGTGFHPELTGRENIFLNGAILGMRRREIQRKFDEIIAFSEIERFLDTPVKRYSSGMYVRLAFAVAAHLDPEILVVDEVLAVGDVRFQKKCIQKMETIAGRGRAVLFVSHNMSAITSLTHRAILLDKGSVLKDSTTDEVLKTYYDYDSDEGTAGVSDVSLLRRDGGEGSIRLTKVSLSNSEGVIGNSYGFGDPIHISLEFESRIQSNDFEIGLGVRTREGALLFVSSSSDSGTLREVGKGRYRITARIFPNYLKPNQYRLSVGITCGVLRDLLNEAIDFEINSSVPHSKSPLIRLPGYLQFDYEWSEVEETTLESQAIRTELT